MKGIVLRDYEVRRLASAGSVLIWRRVKFSYKPYGDERFIRIHPGFPDGSTRAIFEGLCSEFPFSVICPYTRTGETRFVKEMWSKDSTTMYPCPKAWYKASDDIKSDSFHCCKGPRTLPHADCLACWEEYHGKFRWRSPAVMPAEASRFRVTLSVSCRQIQSVTEEEAVRCYHDKHPSPSRIPGSLKHRAVLSYLLEQVYPGCTSREDWFWAIECKEVK